MNFRKLRFQPNSNSGSQWHWFGMTILLLLLSSATVQSADVPCQQSYDDGNGGYTSYNIYTYTVSSGSWQYTCGFSSYTLYVNGAASVTVQASLSAVYVSASATVSIAGGVGNVVSVSAGSPAISINSGGSVPTIAISGGSSPTVAISGGSINNVQVSTTLSSLVVAATSGSWSGGDCLYLSNSPSSSLSVSVASGMTLQCTGAAVRVATTLSPSSVGFTVNGRITAAGHVFQVDGSFASSSSSFSFGSSASLTSGSGSIV
ncbi:GPI-anchored surface protein, putative, partial [Bodo saltans]